MNDSVPKPRTYVRDEDAYPTPCPVCGGLGLRVRYGIFCIGVVPESGVIEGFDDLPTFPRRAMRP